MTEMLCYILPLKGYNYFSLEPQGLDNRLGYFLDRQLILLINCVTQAGARLKTQQCVVK